MRISELVQILSETKDKYGDLEIDLLTEFEVQHEQPLGEIAVASSFRGQEARVKLLPEGFE